jgi:restriction endonuclease S subunit
MYQIDTDIGFKEKEVGLIPSDWECMPFEEIIIPNGLSYGIVQPGFHQVKNSVPVLRVNNIKGGRILPDDVMMVDAEIEKKYARTRLKGGELVLTVVGSVGECAIVKNEYAGWNVARAVSVSNISDRFDKSFIKYCFSFEPVKYQMYSHTNDTVQPTLNLSALKQIYLPIPPLVEQKAIAAILSSLDDKIDLLHRQNKTLEALAETLFRHCFVEAAAEGAKGTIGDYVKVQGGYAFKSKDFKEVGFAGVIKITNISMTSVDIVNTQFIDEAVVKNIDEYKFRITSGNFLIAMTGAEIGKIGIVENTTKQIWLNQRVGRLIAKVPYGDLVGYLAFKSREGQDHIMNAASGSAQENISSSDLEEMEFVAYSEERTSLFGKEAKPLFEKITFDLKQISTLTCLRDTLLPKLMSGEVRVKLPLAPSLTKEGGKIYGTY